MFQVIGNGLKWFFGMIFGDRYKLVYWVIAAATAQHTAWGAATTMQGTHGEGAAGWWAQGIAFAMGVDVLMVMVATKVRTGATSQRYRLLWFSIPINWYIITFATVAITSFYFQLLYAWNHIDPLTTGGGVAPEWSLRLQGLIDARVVIAPLVLPLIATLYTIGGLGKGGEIARSRNPGATSRNHDAPYVAVDVERLPQPVQPKLLPGATQLRNEDGSLQGYVCPACNAKLSISGWSRHKKSCPQYVALIQNANGYQNGHGNQPLQ